MNEISVYTLCSGKLAAKFADFKIPFETVKKHLKAKGYWTDTHDIKGYDGYAVINCNTYGFKVS